MRSSEVTTSIAVSSVYDRRDAEELRACLRLEISTPIARSPFLFGDNNAEVPRAGCDWR